MKNCFCYNYILNQYESDSQWKKHSKLKCLEINFGCKMFHRIGPFRKYERGDGQF